MSFDILSAVEQANQRQKRVLFEKLQRHLGSLSGKVIAVWGLAFQGRDRRRPGKPALVLIEELLRAGAKVQAHDPAAMETARQQLGSRVTLAGHGFDALAGADALAIVTEWLEYRNPDFARIKQLLKRPLIVDGRNLYDPQKLGRLGFTTTASAVRSDARPRNGRRRVLRVPPVRSAARGRSHRGGDGQLPHRNASQCRAPREQRPLQAPPARRLDVHRCSRTPGRRPPLRQSSEPDRLPRAPHSTLKVGALGTHNSLGLAKQKGARFLLASTSEVYGDPLVHPSPSRTGATSIRWARAVCMTRPSASPKR